MIINHNMNALNAHRNMSMNTVNSGKSMEKLSSGLRINRAGDDAAGLAISEKMRGQIRGLDQAARNSQDGISMIQTAEGALNETHSILQRMKELATQSANDTNTEKDRGQIQNEINQLTSEMNRIGNTTEFNTQKLLDGSKNLTEAKAAMAAGTKVEGKIKVTDKVIEATTTSATLAGGVEIHEGKSATATGDKAFAGLTITDADNELTLTLTDKTGTVKQDTIALTAKAYANDAAGKAQFLTDLNTALDGKFPAGSIVASYDSKDNVVFTTKDTGSKTAIAITGGDMLTHITSDGTSSKISTNSGVDANNTLSIKLGATDETITLAKGTYKNSDELSTAIQTQIASNANLTGKVTVKADGNSLVLTGSDKKDVTVSGGAAQNVLGFSNAKTTKAQDVNNTLSIKVDGEAVSLTMANGEFDLNEVAGMLQNKINAATTTAKDVTVTVKDGALSIESGSKGVTSKVEVTANELSKSLGLTADTTTAKTAVGEDGKDASVTLQIGANQGQAFSMSISDMRSKALGVAGDTGAAAKVADAKFTSTKGVTNGTDNVGAEAALDISDHKSATAAIKVLDDAINTVSTERSKLGAYQNRLEHTIANLGTSSENLTAAESRVRDVDMAKEMMTFSKNNILTQAAQAMLAQAKSQPEGVLQLLR